MSRAGHRCLVLEKTPEFVDRTKGEWIAPWGIAEAQRVGLFDSIVRARGHFLLRYARCGVRVDPQRSLDDALPLSAVPGVDGPLTQRHPDVCQTLFDASRVAGAECVRPVTRITVVPGSAPTVEFETDGRTTTVAARLVVGADGRNSALRRQLGVLMHRDAPHHLFSGLLVDEVDGWPEDLQMTGTVDDVHFLAFPQGQGRVRLYVGFPLDQTRFAVGPDALPADVFSDDEWRRAQA